MFKKSLKKKREEENQRLDWMDLGTQVVAEARRCVEPLETRMGSLEQALNLQAEQLAK